MFLQYGQGRVYVGLRYFGMKRAAIKLTNIFTCGESIGRLVGGLFIRSSYASLNDEYRLCML